MINKFSENKISETKHIKTSYYKSKKRISIVIPVKGIPRSLLKSLRGFLNQTSPPYEIVVVSESKDLVKIKKSLSVKEKRKITFIAFLGDKNEARNRGYLESSGEYILYADHDMIPQANLIESCMSQLERFDAIIIPERLTRNGSFLKQIRRLEKDIVMHDSDAVTPRIFMRSMFNSRELPFDKKFGVLDEWGFHLKLKKKEPRMGVVDSYLTIDGGDLKLWKEVRKNFRKGRWIKNLVTVDKREGLRRINPVKRGILLYGRRLNLMKKEPIVFLGLLFLKSVDLFAFFSGYLVSFVIKSIPHKSIEMK